MAQMRDVDTGRQCCINYGLPRIERDFLPIYIDGIWGDRILLCFRAHINPRYFR
jgi:hypothetical protein